MHACVYSKSTFLEMFLDLEVLLQLSLVSEDFLRIYSVNSCKKGLAKAMTGVLVTETGKRMLQNWETDIAQPEYKVKVK